MTPTKPPSRPAPGLVDARLALGVLALFAVGAGAWFVLRPGAPVEAAASEARLKTERGRLLLLEPVGEVEDFTEFSWSGADARATAFELSVFDAATDERLVNYKHLRDSSWSPQDEQRASWPAEIRWEVTARDDHGHPIATGSERAKRAP